MISAATFPNCCGLNLLHGEQWYSSAEAYFKDFATVALTHKKMPSLFQVGALVFEHKAENEIGMKISEYVEKHGLGVVHRSPPIPNPVHWGREFHVYTWIHNHKALKEHLASLIPPKEPPAPVVPIKTPPPTGVAA